MEDEKLTDDIDDTGSDVKGDVIGGGWPNTSIGVIAGYYQKITLEALRLGLSPDASAEDIRIAWEERTEDKTFKMLRSHECGSRNTLKMLGLHEDTSDEDAAAFITEMAKTGQYWDPYLDGDRKIDYELVKRVGRLDPALTDEQVKEAMSEWYCRRSEDGKPKTK